MASRGRIPESRDARNRMAAVRLERAPGRRTAFAAALLFALPLVVPSASHAQSFFGKNKVQYERRDWFTLRLPHVEVLFYPEEEALARELAEIAESTCVEYDTLFRLNLEKPIPILLFSSHQAFQQSNAAMGFIGEGTGGLTELVKGRVLIPHTGSRRQLVWVTRHELVHAYMLEKLARVQKEHKRYRQSMPPLWFIEGLAEFISTSWDSQAEGLMQDAVLAERAYPVRDSWPIYGTVQMYKEGQSFLEFLARNYSRRHVLDILENYWQRPTFPEVVELVFDRSLESLDDEWFAELKRHYFPRVAERKWAGEAARRMTRGDSYDLAPVALPARADSAQRFCYLSADRAGYALKQVTVPKGGKPREERLLSGGFSASFESFHLFRSRLGVSPRGLVALVSQKEGRDVIHIVDPVTRQVLRSVGPPGTISLASPAWLPGDSVLVVSGQRPDGQSDLFRVRLADAAITSLTDDPYEEDDPTVHPDGRRVVFSSDRQGGAAGLRHLFEMDLETGAVRALTSGSHNEREPAWSPDGSSLVFRSDRAGVDDLYLWREGRIRRLTQLIGPAMTPAFTADGRAILFTGESKLSFHIYRVPVEAEAQKEEAEAEVAVILPEPESSTSGDPKRFAAVTEFPGLPGVDATAIDSTRLHGSSLDRWLTEPVDADLRPWPRTQPVADAAVPYRRRLGLDIAQNGIALDPSLGATGAAQFAVSDLIGDERISFFVANSAQDIRSFFTGLELGVTYYNQRQRLNWGAGVFRLDQIYDPDFNAMRSEKRIGGLLTASYPFSKFTRLEGTLVVRYAKNHYLRSGDFQDLWLASNFLSLVRDNTRWTWLGPAGGTRWNFTAGFTRDLTSGSGDYFTLASDWRTYREPVRNVVSATRVLAQNSFGDNAQMFYLGGRYALRGYPYRSLRGNHSLLVQQELRFPLLHNIRLGVPVDWTLPPISGAVFADLATTGDVGREFEPRASYGASVFLSSYFLPPIRVNFIRRHDFQRAEKGYITEFVLGYSF
jgi:hypothetical protein